MKKNKKTKTSSFGSGRRESHDSSGFYSRKMYQGTITKIVPAAEGQTDKIIPLPGEWADKIYCHSSTDMSAIPDGSVGLAFTSPPYNVGKDYDRDQSLDEYLEFISAVGREVYRVLCRGGRYVINIGNLGRKPYIPLHQHFYRIHQELGFLPMGEIIWQKAQGASGSCAWGSWKSASAPRLRDIHEYLLVFAKEDYKRGERRESDISTEEFMAATLSVWQIPPESAGRVGHPAPFPIRLAERVIKLFSFVGDVVLDPFAGSGTTCVAARETGRHYVGFEIVPEYCALAEKRMNLLSRKDAEIQGI